ncbi:sigma 54-interacting transcriptional regulator [Clostridium hydrogeniformans]|uniref:sigma 54-interacting transcriptional regulator n=1 Tax=Clostridium hydrogeniformans TaxID=349933 RepID=UPI00054D9FFD|nr:sigma 54-interacting transcriptional regulator [Clostridium hydrogeniformans]
MSKIYDYGENRCLEPKNSFPHSAWKLDNKAYINSTELLIKVSVLKLDSNSFKQIFIECDGDENRIKNKILNIVESRGKLHNPVTGTGGILYGKVKNMGINYHNIYKLKSNDNVISLTSLAITPLSINKILSIDSSTGQVYIDGEAIIFSGCPIMKVNNDLPLPLLLAVLDEAGSAVNTYNLAKPTDRILILGASGVMGLICGYAARKKLKNTGKLVGIRLDTDKDFNNKVSTIFDEIYSIDAMKPLEAYESLLKKEDLFDLTINCINNSGSELFSILSTTNKGSLYLSSLGSNYKTTCVSAEGMGRDINIIGYKGYTEGHADFTLQMLKEDPGLKELIKNRLKKNNALPSLSNKVRVNNIESNMLKDISLEEYIFKSEEMKKVLDNALKVANFDCTVLVTGESGVGKEIIINLIHKSSDRNFKPCIKINCASIPKNLLEAELFGYEGGAFTGAHNHGKMGFFEMANGGTLFLDEIGDLPLPLQVKLLRAIQEKEIYRVGGTTPIKIDVRILAATNKNLSLEVSKGSFREDLYYRLHVFPIHIPPLRERSDDIIPLINHFIYKYNKKFKLSKSIHGNTLCLLLEHKWPGNIRELENFIQRLLISSEESIIMPKDVNKILGINSLNKDSSSKDLDYIPNLKVALEELEISILKNAKKKYPTTRKLANALGISQSSLVRKLSKYNLS